MRASASTPSLYATSALSAASNVDGALLDALGDGSADGCRTAGVVVEPASDEERLVHAAHEQAQRDAELVRARTYALQLRDRAREFARRDAQSRAQLLELTARAAELQRQVERAANHAEIHDYIKNVTVRAAPRAARAPAAAHARAHLIVALAAPVATRVALPNAPARAAQALHDGRRGTAAALTHGCDADAVLA